MSSDERRAFWRVKDMLGAIASIRRLLNGKTFDVLWRDEIVRAAFERYLEILSEASSRVPEEWQQRHGKDIPWRNIRGLGNQLRHAYNNIDYEILWNVYERELDPLQLALESMLNEQQE